MTASIVLAATRYEAYAKHICVDVSKYIDHVH